MEEIWKDVKDYEGIYKVSNYGNVISYARNGTRGGEKDKIERHGYYRVKLWKNKQVKTFSIHRLVAQAFVPNPLGKPQVNHKDGNKKNNYFENLEWCSASENMVHAYKNGLVKTRPVYQIKDGKIVNTFLNIHMAAVETKIPYSSIYRCANGILKQAGGYDWHYADVIIEDTNYEK